MLPLKQTLGGIMAYKNIEHDFSFADIAVQKFADKNRSMLFLRQVNNTIDWQPVKNLLFRYYETGKAKEGERAYSPLLLFKCFLLQKWFHPRGIGSAFHRAGIKSDPELESQIYPVK